MVELFVRLSILVLLGIVGWLLVWAGRHFVELQRRQALASPLPGNTALFTPSVTDRSPIQILAFSSPDCRQCHQLQAPALQRVLAAREELVSVVEVDATIEHTLTQTYHILTVPSTVIVDQVGNTCAVNYGFTNTQRLLEQVDEIIAKA